MVKALSVWTVHTGNDGRAGAADRARSPPSSAVQIVAPVEDVRRERREAIGVGVSSAAPPSRRATSNVSATEPSTDADHRRDDVEPCCRERAGERREGPRHRLAVERHRPRAGDRPGTDVRRDRSCRRDLDPVRSHVDAPSGRPARGPCSHADVSPSLTPADPDAPAGGARAAWTQTILVLE